jgi:hypothetical protein
LWEQIHYVGEELRRWARRHKCQARLQGFSTHYNFSFQTEHASPERDAKRLGYLLAHILPAPVILLAANRKSTAVGVRPRGKRIEVTADFTPDAALMLATCAFIAGTAQVVSAWPDYDLAQLEANNIPRFGSFRLRKHSSRQGLAGDEAIAGARSVYCRPECSDLKLQDGGTLASGKCARKTSCSISGQHSPRRRSRNAAPHRSGLRRQRAFAARFPGAP